MSDLREATTDMLWDNENLIKVVQVLCKESLDNENKDKEQESYIIEIIGKTLEQDKRLKGNAARDKTHQKLITDLQKTVIRLSDQVKKLQGASNAKTTKKAK